MYPFLKKISTKKKTVAFVLSLMLLMTIVEPQPVQAEDGPLIEKITPGQVSSAGGTAIEIEGTGLGSTTLVTIGDRSAEIVSVESDQVKVVAPYGDIGSTTLKLVRSDGKSAEATITYRESNPEISNVEPGLSLIHI